MPRQEPDTARRLIAEATEALTAADLHYGHGTTCAEDDAVFLVLHALDLGYDCPEAALDAPVSDAAAARARALVRERAQTHRPAAYIAGRMWFCGLEFAVDERVLVPRSPIAELIEAGYAPWLPDVSEPHILEVGTGSGCIAIATALALPEAHVDATDCSRDALALARRNCARHDVTDRVNLLEADVWPPAGRGPYALIVSNPPYVPTAELATLPREYGFEPAGGLDGGSDGLDFARVLIAGARERLLPGGALVCEVGAQWPLLEEAFPELAFLWLSFEFGGEGVFVLSAEALP